MTTPEFDHTTVNVRLVETTEDAADFLHWLDNDTGPLIGVDVETDGLDWYDGKLRLVQFGNLIEGWAIPFEQFSRLVWEALYRIFGRRQHVVGHNVKFDLHWLERHVKGFKVHDWSLVHDTMLLAGVLDSSGPKGLKDLAEYFVSPIAKVGQTALKDDMKKGGWTWGTVPISLPSYWIYGVLDTILTVHLFYVLLDKAQRAGCMDAYTTERGCMGNLFAQERKGLLVDSEHCSQRMEEAIRRCDEIEDMVSRDWGIDQITSLPQIALAFERSGVVLVETTGSGKWAMNKDAFEGIVARNGDHPLVSLIHDYRQGMKMANSYYANFLKFQRSDGRVHPSYRQMQAKTGRMSCTDPAMQTLPRSDDDINPIAQAVRNSFVADSGNVLVSTDFANIEVRIFAHFAKEAGMLEAIRAGVNFHKYTAQQIYQLDYLVDKKDPRYTLAKNTMFCLPMTTMALTQSGPRHVDDLRVGDMVAGYNGKFVEWTPVRAIHRPGTMEVLTFGNAHRSFRATGNHRWVGEKRANGEWHDLMMTTDEFVAGNADHRIRLAAQFDAPDRSGLSPEQASLLGWLITDGHVRWSTCTSGRTSQAGGVRVGCDARIAQTKTIGRWEVANVLSQFIRSTDSYGYSIHPQAVRDIFATTGLRRDYENLPDVVLRMGTEQIGEFCRAVWTAEGTQKQNRISQNVGPKYEAIRLAQFMNGSFPGRPRVVSTTYPTSNTCVSFTRGLPTMTAQRVSVTDRSMEEVWCITTDLDSFVAVDGGDYFLTGNCTIYGGGPEKIATTAGVPLADAMVASSGLHTAFPGIKLFQRQCAQSGIDNLNQYGQAFIRGIDGRILSMVETDDRYYAFTNWLIQSTAAIVLKQRLAAIDNVGLTDYCVATIHDEVVCEIPAEDEDEFRHLIQEAMTDSFQFSVPIDAETGEGAVRLGDAK